MCMWQIKFDLIWFDLMEATIYPSDFYKHHATTHWANGCHYPSVFSKHDAAIHWADGSHYPSIFLSVSLYLCGTHIHVYLHVTHTHTITHLSVTQIWRCVGGCCRFTPLQTDSQQVRPPCTMGNSCRVQSGWKRCIAKSTHDKNKNKNKQ